MSVNLKWTREQELELINNIANKKGIEQFAQSHGRSVSAVELRLKKIIYENRISGKSLEIISQLLKMDLDKVTQYYYWYKEFKEIKDKRNNVNNLNNDDNILNGGADEEPILKNMQDISSLPAKSIGQIGQQNQLNQLNQSNQTNPYVPIVPQIKKINDMNDAQIEKAFAEPNNLDKIETKLRKLEMENKILKLIVENKELTAKLEKLIEDKKIDPSIKQLIKVVRKSVK